MQLTTLILYIRTWLTFEQRVPGEPGTFMELCNAEDLEDFLNDRWRPAKKRAAAKSTDAAPLPPADPTYDIHDAASALMESLTVVHGALRRFGDGSVSQAEKDGLAEHVTSFVNATLHAREDLQQGLTQNNLLSEAEDMDIDTTVNRSEALDIKSELDELRVEDDGF